MQLKHAHTKQKRKQKRKKTSYRYHSYPHLMIQANALKIKEYILPVNPPAGFLGIQSVFYLEKMPPAPGRGSIRPTKYKAPFFCGLTTPGAS